jgi:hypothetical protein
MQFIGYSVSISGLLVYRAYRQDPHLISNFMNKITSYDVWSRKKKESGQSDEDKGINKDFDEKDVELEELLKGQDINNNNV